MTGGLREQRATWALVGAATLVQLPFLNRGISFLDEGSILSIADALHNGEVLYRDRYTPMGPLCYELLGSLFGLFGPGILPARLLQAAGFLACTVLVYRILRDFVPLRWAWLGAFSCLGLKPLAFPFWTELNYGPLGLAFVLGSMFCVQRYLPRHRSGWLIGAGLASGLAFLTKQNLGAASGLAIGATLAFDAGLHRIGWTRFATRAGLMAGAALLPLGFAAAYYAAHGALGDFVDAAFLAALEMPTLWGLPLPSLAPWPSGTEEFGRLSFAYLPPALVHLTWEGGFGPRAALIQRLIEYGVKAAYYLPLLSLVLGAGIWVQRLRGNGMRARRSRWVLLLVLATGCYVGLYRADWTHLMSVYPIFLLLMTALVAERSYGSRRIRSLALALLVVWLSTAALVSGGIAHIYASPVETPRFKVLAPVHQAEYALRVLEHVADIPADEPLLVLPHEPLLYFLTDRAIPSRFDAILPGIVSAREDRQLAETLRGVRQIIYNSSNFPTLPVSFIDYAPETASRMAMEFRFTDRIHQSIYALERVVPSGSIAERLIDLWAEYDQSLTNLRNVKRVRWLHYRVLAAAGQPSAHETCFVRGHDVRADEAILAVPLTPFDLWHEADSADQKLVFEISRLHGRGRLAPIHTEIRSVDAMPEPLLVPLDQIPEGFTELQFCIRPENRDLSPEYRLRAGWGEPHIVRLPMRP